MALAKLKDLVKGLNNNATNQKIFNLFLIYWDAYL